MKKITQAELDKIKEEAQKKANTLVIGNGVTYADVSLLEEAIIIRKLMEYQLK